MDSKPGRTLSKARFQCSLGPVETERGALRLHQCHLSPDKHNRRSQGHYFPRGPDAAPSHTFVANTKPTENSTARSWERRLCLPGSQRLSKSRIAQDHIIRPSNGGELTGPVVWPGSEVRPGGGGVVTQAWSQEPTHRGWQSLPNAPRKYTHSALRPLWCPRHRLALFESTSGCD